MDVDLHSDPELAEVARQARARAREAGDLPRGPFPSYQPVIPPEAVAIVSGWLRDGGYEDAVAEIAAEDPDLANE